MSKKNKKQKITKLNNNKNGITLKRKDIIDLFYIVNKLGNMKIEDADLKFLYALVKVKKAIQSEVEVYDDLRKKIIELINEYEKERHNICLKYAEKDENNKPIIIGDTYKIDEEKQEEFNKEIEKLKKKYKKELNEYDEKIEELNKFLEEEIEIEIKKIPFTIIPKKLPINLFEMEILSNVIDDSK